MGKSSEYERMILGAIIYDEGVIDEIFLSADDFESAKHQVLFQTILRMKKTDKPIDLITISNEVNTSKIPIAFLSGLPTIAGNIEFYCTEIKKAAAERKIKKIPSMLHDWTKEKDVYEVIEDLEKYLSDAGAVHGINISYIKDLLIDTIEQIEKANQREGTVKGITTGFSRMDFLTDGFQNGNLIIIGARPSIGKTAILLDMAVSAAKAGHTAGFFSLEMSKQALMHRVLASVSRIELISVRAGRLRSGDFHKLVQGAEEMNRLQIMIDDTPNIHIRDLRLSARVMKRRGAKIIFVDYLTLIRDSMHNMPRWERVGEMTKELRRIARDLDIPIVVASQVGREAEGKRPTLADLRQSGAVEEDADVVILMHRERTGRDLSLFIEKQRNGPCEEVLVTFDKEYARFIDGGGNERR